MNTTAIPPAPQLNNISPPIGGKKRGRPKNSFRRNVCEKFGVSMRNLERAERVRRYGILELHGFVERGELDLGPAEIIARMPQDLQRQACALGAPWVRIIANDIRRELKRAPKATAAGLA